jgi:chemotaxis protein histidine kinase CheA
MQDHGGEVSVESTGPHGTVFRLRIPVTVPAGLIVSIPIARESLHSRMRERPSPL